MLLQTRIFFDILKSRSSFSNSVLPAARRFGWVLRLSLLFVALPAARAAITVTGDASPTSSSSFWTDGGSTTTNGVIGATATGTLSITGGSILNLAYGQVGGDDGGNGTATVNGGTWIVRYDLDVGYNSAGSLLITGGGIVSSLNAYLGHFARTRGHSGGTGAVTVTGQGSQWLVANNLYVGDASAGNTLTVADGGTVRVGATGAGTLTLGNAEASGTLNIGAASGQAAAAPGFIEAATVKGGTGAGDKIVNFNHTAAGYVFAANLTGLLAVQQNGGTTILTGANTFAGATTLNAGTLKFARQVSLYNNTPASWTAANLTVNSGATAAFNVGGTGEFTTANIATLAALGTATGGFQGGSRIGLDTTNATGGNFTHATAIADTNGGANSLGLTKLGTGTLTLTGANTYTGTTTISGGTLQIGDGGTTGSLASNAIVNNAALAFNRADSSSYTGAISGIGTLAKSGSGTLTLAATSTYTGTTTISGGRLVLGGNSASSGFAIAAGATLELNVASGDRNFATTTFSGAGNLVKTGSNAAYWGAGSATFQMAAGSLIDVQAGSLFGGSNGNEVWTNNLSGLRVASGAAFYGVEANVRVDALTGAGQITSGYSGGDYQSFTFGVADGSGTFSGILADHPGFTGNFTKAGTGTQTLSGANTYTGTTTISGGTLQIGDGGTTGSLASGAIVNNATLAFNRSDAMTYGGVISGFGNLTKSGAGTLTMSGANTYSGGTTLSAGGLIVQKSLFTANGAAGAVGSPGGAASTVVAGGSHVTLAVGPIGSLTGGVGGDGRPSSSAPTPSGLPVGEFSGGAGAAVAVLGSDATFENAGTVRAGDGGAGRLMLSNAGGSSTNYSGAGGNGGVGASLGADGTVVNSGSLAGGHGGSTVSIFSGYTQYGGAGGSGGRGASLGARTLLSNSGSIVGGDGQAGAGANAGLGYGGVGGNGAVGASVGANSAVDNAGGTIRGGNGGAGGYAYSQSSGAYGGAAGAGGIGLSLADDSTVTNSGTIIGGNGATGGYAWTAAGAGYTTSVGASSAGATAVAFLNRGTITNTGTITGGNGAAGSFSSVNGARTYMPPSGGGSAITGADLTIVNSGTLTAGLSGDGVTRANAIVLGGTANTLELRAGSAIVGNVLANGSADTLILGGAADATLSSPDIGTAYNGFEAVQKTGVSTWTLTGNSTYTGPTAINGGKLVVGGSLASSAIAINNTGTLGGSGTVGAVTINSGGTVSPGNSPGALTTGSETWNVGGKYVWELNDATGTPGATSGTGWDWLNITGVLSIASTTASKFTIEITSLGLDNLPGSAVNLTGEKMWVLATASDGITGFSADKFRLDASHFVNQTDASHFSLSVSGNDLILSYTAVPEPSTYAIGLAALLGGAILLRCRRESSPKRHA